MRVKGLLHHGIEAPALDVASQFFTDFGLAIRESHTAVLVGCDGHGLDEVLVTEGPCKRLHHIAFAVDPGSLSEWQRHLESRDVMLDDAPPGGPEGGLWLHDDDGNATTVRDNVLRPWGAFTPMLRTSATRFGESIAQAGNQPTRSRGRADSPSCSCSPATYAGQRTSTRARWAYGPQTASSARPLS